MPKWLKRCGCLVVLVPILLILGYLVFCIVYSVVDNTIGLTGHTAEQQWYRSMQRGDGQAAIYWARRIIDLKNPALHETWKNANYSSLPEDYGMTDHNYGFRLSLAYELHGEYDMALRRYKMSGENPQRYTMPGFGYHPLHIARVLYKMGRHTESFERYWEYCKNETERRDVPNDSRRLEKLYDRIMCHDIIYDSRKFRPFATFHDFYEFMKTEYEKSGKRYEKAKVMEFIHRADSYTEANLARHHE